MIWRTVFSWAATHSKETVDAFIKNEFRNEDIAAFRLIHEADQVRAERFEGPRLARLLDAVDFDIRR